MRRRGSPAISQLGRLIVLWDDNRITIDGSTDLSRNEDVIARYEAMRWHTLECDGLDCRRCRRRIDEALADPRPSLIRCKTIIGYGAPNKQGTAATHGAALGEDEIAAARKELGWKREDFAIPDDVARRLARAWRARRQGARRMEPPARRAAARRTNSSAA